MPMNSARIRIAINISLGVDHDDGMGWDDEVQCVVAQICTRLGRVAYRLKGVCRDLYTVGAVESVDGAWSIGTERGELAGGKRLDAFKGDDYFLRKGTDVHHLINICARGLVVDC